MLGINRQPRPRQRAWLCLWHASLLVALANIWSNALASSSVDHVFAVGVRGFDAGEYYTARQLFEACGEFGDVGAYNNAAISLIKESATKSADVVSLLEKAAASGLPVAKFNLANILRQQAPDKLVNDRILQLWTEAADAGFLPAVVNLNIVRLTDTQTTPDQGRQARAAIEDAALRGNVAAQYALAVLTERGLFGEQSAPAALHWFGQSAASGFEPARQRIAETRGALADVNQLGPPVLAFDDELVLERRSMSERTINPKDLDNAWDMSIFDMMSSEKRELYQQLTEKELSGHLGLRYGHSLTGAADPLTGGMQAIGAMAEIRKGWLSGARLYADYFPRAEAEVDGKLQYCQWSRLLAGWAFAIPSPKLVDRFHITPKLGSYTLAASLPNPSSPAWQDDVVAIEMSNEPAIGLEVDAELSRFWYVVRGSFAWDLPALLASQAESRGGSVETTRTGIDLLLKGAGLGFSVERLSLAYLVFVAREHIKVTTTGETAEVFELDLPLAGVGVSIAW